MRLLLNNNEVLKILEDSEKKFLRTLVFITFSISGKSYVYFYCPSGSTFRILAILDS